MPAEVRAAPVLPAHDPSPRPNLTGDLDAILVTVPTFRQRLHGYDPLQVDNYVRWAETELLSTRREVDDLALRYGACVAEVRRLQQAAAQTPEGRQLHQVSERIDQMLQLAAATAATLRADAAMEADRILDDARAAAEAAVATADKLHTDAREELAQADATLVRAGEEATHLLEEAAAERDRLADQAAAERAAQLAAANAELADLADQRDQARQCLSRLGAQIAQALDELAEGLPRDVRVPQNVRTGSREHVLSGNRVAAS